MGNQSANRRIILFDIGGVLVHSNGIQALQRLLPSGNREEEILHRWNQSHAVLQFERGRSTPSAFASAFVEEWCLEMTASDFLAFFSEWVPGYYEGAIPLIETLKERYTVGCLSNSNEIHWSRLDQIDSLFHFTVVSHRTGWMKPAREAYEQVLKTVLVPPSDVFFLDDSAHNVVAAQAVGFRAHMVRGIEEARAILATEGFIPCK